MLRINRQTDYAVRVILALASEQANTRLSTTVIQKDMRIPPSFTPRIVAQLANASLIRTFTGRDGGLQLARPAAEITILDVVSAFEGPVQLSECMQQARGEDDCPFHGDCQVRSRWGRVQASLLREMSLINFADLAAEGHSKPAESIVPSILV